MLWNLGGFNPADGAPGMLNSQALGANPGMFPPNLVLPNMLTPDLGQLVPNALADVPPNVRAPVPQAQTPVPGNAPAMPMARPEGLGTPGGGTNPLREAGTAAQGPAQGGVGGAISRAGSALSGIKGMSGGNDNKVYSPRAPEPSQRIDQGQLLQLVTSMMGPQSISPLAQMLGAR